MGNEAAAGTRRAVLIGCGIAGPVLAMFLQRIGITAVIYEGIDAPRDEVGAFLNLAPNGLAVLDTLGIRAEVEKYGTQTTSTAFLNHKGKQLGLNPAETLLIRRGLLTKGLREAAVARGVQVEFGKFFESVEHTGDGIVARFKDGSTAEGDFLVGCDGIHSKTRYTVLPDAPHPQYTGVIGTAGYTRSDQAAPADGVMRMTFCLEGFFGYQTFPSGEIYWFENYHQAKEPERGELDRTPHEVWKPKLLAKHRQDHHPISAIIESTQSGILGYPIYDMLSIPTWHKDLVCLVGDAAHATSPHVGQGASMAMEDSIVLTKCLRDLPDPQQAFAAFQALRKERVEKIIKEGRKTGNQKAASNNFQRTVRDLVLPFFLKLGVKATHPVYAYRVDWDEPTPAPAASSAR
ncbi:FAD-dependent monooxygenase [Streptomyces lunaelactis]|uniref:FAD-dependent monooxygenase n=1 Tax=Streptomyces lunaelactis TaxID=1535768 RepID=UPI00158586EF|nr:FAD-dependent monooxygenase [Streptomyces lunaelactis]NUK00667.1 FAD-dependent monooxygenase [Streptomyces lunaelactis]NUK06611.1 FAD-dependent monooxygenase [Streptomyces lunaelactis]NUK14387.1 FAD-dependent monooxygenase [Streptomyces lunaelactis]NUK21448.1 FAD-dependent monooxygenase [Streptomyces lunaelactis]NUK33472.1 FAD-dependent monooxygenase [Streptomyces lunaelactis]